MFVLIFGMSILSITKKVTLVNGPHVNDVISFFLIDKKYIYIFLSIFCISV